MEVTNAEWIVGRHGRPLMTVRDQQGLSRFSEEPHLLRESLMTQTKRQSKLRLFALALLAALAMSAGLVRGPTDEEVLAQAVRDVAFGDRTVLHPAAVAMVHADERPQVTNVTESKCQHSTPNHAEKKGQPITLSLTSTDRPHRFLLEALKIDRDIPPRNNNGE